MSMQISTSVLTPVVGTPHLPRRTSLNVIGSILFVLIESPWSILMLLALLQPALVCTDSGRFVKLKSSCRSLRFTVAGLDHLQVQQPHLRQRLISCTVVLLVDRPSLWSRRLHRLRCPIRRRMRRWRCTIYVDPWVSRKKKLCVWIE